MQQTNSTGNIVRLAIAQALSMTTMNVNIINTALVGSLLTSVEWLPRADGPFSASIQGVTILVDNFVLFWTASMTFGVAHGCKIFYRYAATDCDAEQEK